jgi:hypothetical protein
MNLLDKCDIIIGGGMAFTLISLLGLRSNFIFAPKPSGGGAPSTVF